MKKILMPCISLSLVMICVLSSCKKKDSTPAETPSTTTGNTTNTTTAAPSAAMPITANDANGVLVALRVNAYTSYSVTGFGMMTTGIHLDNGIALFPSVAGGTTYLDAGTVTLNTTGLDKQSNNQYMKSQQVNQSNFGLDTQVKWNVAGNSSVTAVTNFYAPSLPQYDSTYFNSILTGNTITKSSGLTFSLSSKLSGGSTDSVICMIVGGGTTKIMKTVHRTVSSVTFSASDLSALSNTTSGQFQITPYRIIPNTTAGKKYYYICEQAYVSTGVTVQ